MKIAINATYNPSGGARVMLVNMVKYFLNDKNLYLVIFIKKEDKHILDEFNSKNIKFIFSKISSISVFMRVFWEQSFLPILAIKERVDILFCPNNIAPILSSVKTIQLIATIGPFFKEYYKGFNFIGRLKLHLNKFLMIISARRSDFVIHQSNFSQKLFLEYNTNINKSAVFRMGMDKYFYPASMEQSQHINNKYNLTDPYILSVTKFLPYKNLLRLIIAFSKTRIYNPKIKLVIVGEIFSKEYYLKIIDKIEFLSLDKDVIILNEIPRDDLLFLYSRCIFMAYTSLYESCGYILMEAMSSGAAICCSRTTAIPEACEDAALYFDPYSTKDIAEKMRLLIENKKIRESLKSKSISRSKQIDDFESITLQINHLIKNLVKGKPV